MSKIRNKIITISGDPRSGKTTLVEYLVEILENMGFRVHVRASGDKYREISQQRYLEKYPDRVNAKQADIQTDESFAKERREIDEEVDRWLVSLREIINCKETPKDIYIIDSRLAWYFMGEGESYDVRITVKNKIEAGRRALKDKSKGPQDSYKDLPDAVEHTSRRTIAERERYIARGIDIEDSNNFNYNKDTSDIEIGEYRQLAMEIIEGAFTFWKKRETEKTDEGR